MLRYAGAALAKNNVGMGVEWSGVGAEQSERVVLFAPPTLSVKVHPLRSSEDVPDVHADARW